MKEHSFNTDLTFRHQAERARAELSIYRNHINDYIFLEPDTAPTLTIRGAFPTFRFRQTNAELLGAELSLEYQFLVPLKVSAIVSFVRGNDLDRNEPLFQMPADRMKLTAHYDLIHDEPGTFEEMFAELSIRAVDRQTRVPSKTDYAPPPPGYVLVDASLSTNILLLGTTWHASLACENILNKDYRDYLSRYRYFASDPGRTIALRISIPFGDQPTNHNEP
jgi:iron complex outermembrane receptor protein